MAPSRASNECTTIGSTLTKSSTSLVVTAVPMTIIMTIMPSAFSALAASIALLFGLSVGLPSVRKSAILGTPRDDPRKISPARANAGAKSVLPQYIDLGDQGGPKH